MNGIANSALSSRSASRREMGTRKVTPPTSLRGDPLILEESDFSFHRRDQFRWIVADALLEDHLDVSHIADARRWISRDHDEVGVLTDCDRTRAIGPTEEGRAV